MADPVEYPAPSAADIAAARRYLQPLFDTLCGQGGGATAATITDSEGGAHCMIAAHVRKLRRAMYPMPADLRAVADPYREYTTAGEAERRRLRAIYYPERERGVSA